MLHFTNRTISCMWNMYLVSFGRIRSPSVFDLMCRQVSLGADIKLHAERAALKRKPSHWLLSLQDVKQPSRSLVWVVIMFTVGPVRKCKRKKTRRIRFHSATWNISNIILKMISGKTIRWNVRHEISTACPALTSNEIFFVDLISCKSRQIASNYEDALRSLYSKIQCIMGNGHMGTTYPHPPSTPPPPPPACGQNDRQTRLKTLPFRRFVCLW